MSYRRSSKEPALKRSWPVRAVPAFRFLGRAEEDATVADSKTVRCDLAVSSLSPCCSA
jgi:hypothetical protein